MKYVLAILMMFTLLTANAVTAKSYIVTDMDGAVLLEKNADEVRPIASITKLVTAKEAIAFDPEEGITITREDHLSGKMRSTPLRIGQTYTRDELTKLALVSSDNIAAIALARTSHSAFTLPPTMRIVEGSGLNVGNVSSARDIAELARSMVNTDLAKASVEPAVTIDKVTKRSTNPLINRPGWLFSLSKTGFTNPAGGCLVAVFESGGRLVTAVILGSRNVPARWSDLIQLRRQLNSEDVFEGLVTKKSVTTRKRRYK